MLSHTLHCIQFPERCTIPNANPIDSTKVNGRRIKILLCSNDSYVGVYLLLWIRLPEIDKIKTNIYNTKHHTHTKKAFEKVDTFCQIYFSGRSRYRCPPICDNSNVSCIASCACAMCFNRIPALKKYNFWQTLFEIWFKYLCVCVCACILGTRAALMSSFLRFDFVRLLFDQSSNHFRINLN